MPRRKSSTRVTLVLIGVAALAGCGKEDRRDVYATREDCLADWNNKPDDCKPATEGRHASQGFWYGPSYGYTGTPGRARSIGSASSSSRSWSSSSSSISRGGFGSSARSSGG